MWNLTAYSDKQTSVTGRRAAETCMPTRLFFSLQHDTNVCLLRFYVHHCIIGHNIFHGYSAFKYRALFNIVKTARCSKERWCNQKLNLWNLVCVVSKVLLCFLSIIECNRNTSCCMCNLQAETQRIFELFFLFLFFFLPVWLHAACIRSHRSAVLERDEPKHLWSSQYNWALKINAGQGAEILLVHPHVGLARAGALLLRPVCLLLNVWAICHKTHTHTSVPFFCASIYPKLQLHPPVDINWNFFTLCCFSLNSCNCAIIVNS